MSWSGHIWLVRDDTGGPGPNRFSPRNVSVDSSGALHLRISKAAKLWSCAEIYTNEKLGYGTYTYTIESRVDRLDQNVVFGLFNYPDDAVDGTNELDIEYARWGVANGPNLAFTAYPSLKHSSQVSQAFPVKLRDPATINQFTWKPGSVAFKCSTDSGKAAHEVFAQWQTPASFAQLVSHIAMPVHLNLWLFQSPAPSDQQPVEVIVKRFEYTPLP